VAAVVPIADLDLLQALEDQADVKAALRARKEKGAVPLQKIKARQGMKWTMRPYEVYFKPSADRQVRKLPVERQRRIVARIAEGPPFTIR